MRSKRSIYPGSLFLCYSLLSFLARSQETSNITYFFIYLFILSLIVICDSCVTVSLHFWFSGLCVEGQVNPGQPFFIATSLPEIRGHTKSVFVYALDPIGRVDEGEIEIQKDSYGPSPRTLVVKSGIIESGGKTGVVSLNSLLQKDQLVLCPVSTPALSCLPFMSHVWPAMVLSNQGPVSSFHFSPITVYSLYSRLVQGIDNP